MSFLLGDNEQSLIEDGVWLLIYGFANYWRDRGLASSRKESSQKSESSSDYSTNEKSSSIRGKFSIPCKRTGKRHHSDFRRIKWTIKRADY